GDVAVDQRLSLPIPGTTIGTSKGGDSPYYLSQAALSADARTIYAVTRGGLIFAVDMVSRTVRERIQLPLPSDDVVTIALVKLTRSGDQLLLGVGPFPARDTLHANAIVVVDTSTLRETSTIATQSFSAFDVASDGLRVFTIDYESRLLRAVSLVGSYA